MAKVTIDGMEAWGNTLNILDEAGRNIATRAVYAGAGVAAEEIRSVINELPVSDRKTKRRIAGVTLVERDGLLDGLGIAKMQHTSDSTDTAVSFSGYNKDISKANPKGKANIMIARSLEIGTSMNKPTRFFTKAVNRAENKVELAMEAAGDEILDDILKE